MKFPESKLAHEYLDGLDVVVEIGAAAHNPFNVKCNTYINVDFSDDEIFHRAQMDYCGEVAKVHIMASADELPFEDESVNAILNSHVLEHCFDPIKTLAEWMRVIKKGGYLFMIIPHKERTFDHAKPLTTISELIERTHGRLTLDNYGIKEDDHRHWNIWDTNSFLDLSYVLKLPIINHLDVDDKVGNGFTIVIQK